MRIKLLVSLLVLSLLLAGVSSFALAAYDYDFEGETLKIDYHGKNEITPFGPRGEYSWFDPDPRLQEHIESVEEMFNVQIEFVEEANQEEALRTGVLAGDAPFDVVLMSMKNIPEYALEGFIYPLESYIDEDYWDDLPPLLQKAKEGMSIGGTQYAFPVFASSVWDAPGGIIWNKSMVEREGLPSVYDLIENDEWTWETFKEMAEAVTRDTNGDGEIDQRGYRTHYFGTRPFGWALSNGASFLVEEDGRQKLSLNTPATLEAFEFLQEIYQQGIGVKGWSSSLPDNILFEDIYLHQLFKPKQKKLEDEYGIAPLPMGPNASDYVVTEQSYMMGGVIPITTDHDPRAIIEVAHALQKTKKPYADWDNLEKRIWRDAREGVMDEESFEIYKWMRIETQHVIPPEYWFAFKESGLTESVASSEAISGVLMEGDSAASLLDAKEPIIQSIVDEMLGLK